MPHDCDNQHKKSRRLSYIRKCAKNIPVLLRTLRYALAIKERLLLSEKSLLMKNLLFGLLSNLELF